MNFEFYVILFSKYKMSIIIFPIFAECSKYTLDSYWKELFNDFASNKFVKGVKYDSRKNLLFVKKDTGEHTALAIPNEPQRAYLKIIDLLKNNLGLRSQRDMYFQQQEISKMKRENVILTNVLQWKKIKSKFMKERLLYNYLYSLVEKYSLNMKEKKHLFAVITLGFLFKSLISDDVIYEGGQVTNIKGLQFDAKTRAFSVVNNRKKKCTKQTEKVSDSFATICHKYIKDEQEKKLLS